MAAKVCGNSPNKFSGTHRNVSDPNVDDTILAGTKFELEFKSEGDHEERIKELEEKVLHLTRQVEDLQSSNDQLTHATIEYQGEIDKLSKQLRDSERQNHQEKSSLQAKVNELQAKVNELQKRLDELKVYERERDKLYLSQVAVEFETAICSHVLPEVFSTSGGKIEDLLNILNSGDEESLPLDPVEYDNKTILREARRKWEGICGVLNLPPEWKKRTGKKRIDLYCRSDPDIFRAIGLLKRTRNFVAHPSPVSVQMAEEAIKTDSIKGGLKAWEYKLVKGFILSLRENIEKIGIITDKDSRLQIE